MPKVTTGLCAAGGIACVRAAVRMRPEHVDCPSRLWIIRDGSAYIRPQHAKHLSL